VNDIVQQMSLITGVSSGCHFV